jgi:catechol 2,3-dioxygenase-like lactoylglutathione lyase family enzyme
MARALALDHLVLVVGDVDRTLAWYGRHAGLPGVRIDEWRRGEAPFPSLRIDESTIIDLVPATAGDADGRGHLDHICFVVAPDGLESLAADPELEIVDQGPRFGARGQGESIYVRDPDDLLVEFRCYRD